MEPVAETEPEPEQVAEITGPVANWSDMLELLQVSAQKYDPAGKRISGLRDMEGWGYERWTDTIDDLRSIGLDSVPVSGKGTMLKRYSVQAALAFVRHQTAPRAED